MKTTPSSQSSVVSWLLLTVLALFAAGWTSCERTEGDVPVDLQADLQAILDDAVANKATLGAVVHVSTGAGETWSTAAGISSLESYALMAPSDRFRAGSIMKPLVATAVLQAAEAEKLSLEDVLTQHLPPAVTGGIQNAEHIRIRMLLSHRSGIPDFLNDRVTQAIASNPSHVWTLDDILAEVETLPPVFSPDERYQYSNTNYILLGEILSAVHRRPWREVIRDQVVARAGLEQTVLPDVGEIECPAPCAHGYLPINGQLLDLTRIDPSMAGAAGGHALVTRSADLALFFRTLQSGALFDKPSTLLAMLAFQPAPDPELNGIGYGYGVMMFDVHGQIAYGHLGGTAGYQSFMLYVPATDRYVTGFINVFGKLGTVLEPIIARVGQP